MKSNRCWNIPIKYHADIYPLEKTEKGDWIDLRAAEDVELAAGESKCISLGVSMKLPDGYEALIIPRSSTFKHWGIIQTNHMGLIDNSYCGDDDVWMFPALATRDVLIEKNSRICQFRIQKKMDDLRFIPVGTMGNANRGGFGSSGKV
jgi:dUTP pyrophosphatase